MSKRVLKVDLPSKLCPICERPFSWRKKWARHWNDVIYCSEKCRRNRKGDASAASSPKT